MLKLPASLIASALILTCVAGCSIQRAQQAQDAQTKMVGMPKEKILACMGIPAAKAAEGATEVWSYNSGNGYSQTVGGGSANTTATGVANNVGNTTYGTANANTDSSFFAIGQKRFCTVNVVMNADHVSAVNYSGPTGGILTKGEQCAFAVENCVH